MCAWAAHIVTGMYLQYVDQVRFHFRTSEELSDIHEKYSSILIWVPELDAHVDYMLRCPGTLHTIANFVRGSSLTDHNLIARRISD